MPLHPLGDLALRLLILIAAGYIIVRGISSALRTFVLPRSAYDPISSATFRVTFALFRLIMRLRKLDTYEGRDKLMALFAPIALLLLPTVWITTVLTGFALIYWALGSADFVTAFSLSGSSITTLGFATSEFPAIRALEFLEAVIGLILTALLISYLPTIYGAFSRRETAVAMLEVRAGTPPFVATMVERFHRLGRLDRMGEIWSTWEQWFAEIDETHTSLVALVFFRSPRGDRSWITAAGAVLDSASFTVSVLDIPRDVEAQICIRAGYLALRHIADYFSIPYNPDPQPDDPISINRSEFDEVCAELETLGVGLKPDRDQAWRDFAGWRVNYDTVLLALSRLTMAPYAPWSSDRSILSTSADSPKRLKK